MLLLVAVRPGLAQVTSQQARAIRDNAPVFVVAQDGTWTGRLLAMDGTTVTIQPHDGPPRSWPLADVLRVDTDRWDSSLDGAFAGAVAMAAYSLIAGATIAAEAANKSAAFATLTAAGALAGYAIDARHRSKVTVSLYKRDPAAPSHKSPGLFFTVRFQEP
jgi:hypothetical protein